MKDFLFSLEQIYLFHHIQNQNTHPLLYVMQLRTLMYTDNNSKVMVESVQNAAQTQDARDWIEVKI